MTIQEYLDIHIGHRKVREKFAGQLEAHNITPIEAATLHFATNVPMGKIAAELGISFPQATQYSKRLSQLGLVTITGGNPPDKRYRYIRATRKGEALLTKLETDA